MRVLVIEDEPNLREQLQQYLQQQGYAVDVAEDGEAGFFMGREYPFDLAIVDLALIVKEEMDEHCPYVCLDEYHRLIKCKGSDCRRSISANSRKFH